MEFWQGHILFELMVAWIYIVLYNVAKSGVIWYRACNKKGQVMDKQQKQKVLATIIQYGKMADVSVQCPACQRNILWQVIGDNMPDHCATVIGNDDDGDLHGIYNDDDCFKVIGNDDDKWLVICPYCGGPVAYADDRNLYPFATVISVPQ